MNKQELIDSVSAKADVSTTEGSKMVATVLEAIASALESGGDVAIKGFGTFKVKTTAKKQGRNPKTGASITIPAGKKISFSVSPILKERVNS